MNTEISTQPGIAHDTPSPAMRLVNINAKTMPELTTRTDQQDMDVDDPRWIFAMRARICIEYNTLDDNTMEYLVRQGSNIGLGLMQSRAIIAIIQDASLRGGFDQTAQQQILHVPFEDATWNASMSDRTRWLTFGALFAWAMIIAGLMQFVA